MAKLRAYDEAAALVPGYMMQANKLIEAAQRQAEQQRENAALREEPRRLRGGG